MATLYGGWQMPVNDLVQWTPADTDVAVVEPGGARVIGVAPGQTQIEAYEASSKSTSTFNVTVLPPKMIDIVILPLGATIPVGQKLPQRASHASSCRAMSATRSKCCAARSERLRSGAELETLCGQVKFGRGRSNHSRPPKGHRPTRALPIVPTRAKNGEQFITADPR